MIQVHQFSCLSDNYAYLIHCSETGETATIDTPDAARILEESQRLGWPITAIWNTHWHADHAGGNAEIVKQTGARVIGPAEISKTAPAPDLIPAEGEIVPLGKSAARVIATPGHTLGHIAYVFDAEKLAFVGDTMFALGCGRLFEGSPAQMWESLNKLAALPDDTMIYCAHEYTQSNARFALSVDPDNAALKARAAQVDQMRAQNMPTVPTNIGLEKATSPFLRAPILPQMAGLGDPVVAFAEVRRRKDVF